MQIDKILVGIVAQIHIYGLKVLGAIAIVAIGFTISKFLSKQTKALLLKRNFDTTLSAFVSNLIKSVINIFVFIAAINQVGIETTSIVAIIGAAGLAIGLALQGTLSNFSAGVMLIIFRDFVVGDSVEGAGKAGVVERIGLFTTTLLTPDNRRIIIPNSKLIGDIIINSTAKEVRRIDLTLRFTHQDEFDSKKAILLDLLKVETRILQQPAPSVSISEISADGYTVSLKVWVNTPEYSSVMGGILEQLKKNIYTPKVTE